MDEQKKYLVDIESNLKEYTDQAALAAVEIERLQREIKNLKVESLADVKVREQMKGQLKEQQQVYRQTQTNIVNLTAAHKAEAGSYQELYQQWKVAQTQLKLMGNAYVVNKDGVRELSAQYVEQSKKVAEAKEALDAFGKGVNDNRLNVGNYTGALEKWSKEMGIIPGMFGQIIAGLRSMTVATEASAAGVTGLAAAVKRFMAIGLLGVITAIVSALGALTAYFKRSEEGQNALTKVTKVFQSVIQNVLDVVSKLGKGLFEAFSNPKKAVEDLWEAIKKNLVNRVQGTLDFFVGVFNTLRSGFAGVAKSLQAAFTLDADKREQFKKEAADAFDTMKKEIAGVGESMVQIVTGVDNFVGKAGEAIRKFGKEVRDDMSESARIADALAKLAQDERRMMVENTRLATQSAKLRADAEKLKYQNAEQSIALQNEAFDIDEKILARELDIAQRKAENARAEAELSNTTKEVLDEIARLEADVEAKRGSFEEKRREMERAMNRLKREAFQQEQEQVKALMEIEQSRVNATITQNDKIAASDLYTYEQRQKALQDNLSVRTELLQKQADLELRAIEKDLELETISQENAEIKKLAVIEKYQGEQLKMSVETIDKQNKLLDDQLKWENNWLLEDQKNKIAIRELQNEYEFTLQREKLAIQERQELLAAEESGAAVNLIYEKYALARQEIDRLENEAKLVLYSEFAGSIAGLFGKQTALGKAAAVAQATVSTYLAAQKHIQVK